MAAPNSSYTYFNVSHPVEYVAHVEINRPAKLNAFIPAMWQEVAKIFNYLSHDPDTRAIVLSGAGEKAFTTGLDVQAAMQEGALSSPSTMGTDTARSTTALRREIADFQECVGSIDKCEKPVIAVLHGHSLGLAIDIATCADIRICAANTNFIVKEVDIGLAADVGTLTRLPKVVSSYSWVKDVCFTARPFGPEEALRVGLVSSIWPSKEKAIEAGLKLAQTIAEKSPVAVQGTKEILNWSRDRSVEDGLRYTQVWNAAAIQTKDVQLAGRAVMTKKKPTFEKL
ncbi:MAG: hypothetical protein M4579_002691 [Chaenotheca gracillima]|nr:MAG: hypothetical protein M4579_002691 [Chaenotheca gracillima]